MMITIEDIHKHIEKNSIPKNGLIYIGDETLKIIRNCKDFHDTFNKIPAEGYDRIVFFGTTDDYGRFHLKINYSEFKEKPKFTSETLIENAFVLGDIHFSDIVFNENFSLTIEDTGDNVSISFVNCHFMGKLKIRNKENNDCEEDCKDCEEYSQKKTKLKSLKFIDCLMGSSKTHITPYLRCGFLCVDKFVLKNLRVPAGAEVNIGECHFKNFHLSNFRNLGKFKLYKINENDEDNSNYKFQIDNTSIGDTDFQSVNLVSFTERVIFDNILSGINYTNVQWENPGTDIKVGQYNSDRKIEIRKKRDTYRVLKNVAQRNNDMQQALAFYAKEMEWHRKSIKGNANKSFERLFASYIEKIEFHRKLNRNNTTKLFDRMLLFFVHNFRKVKWFVKSLKDRINKRLDRSILFFGRWTNNHGQNWFLPIFWIAGLGIIFYAGLLWVLPGDVWVLERWVEFPLFLNPTHKIEFICENYWNFRAYTIDTLFRIFEGALIYQAIQAFRKYSRRF